ncbi:uncharacterized protein TNCV_2492791 [Trichonephila clavipes]|uniref:Uncharacterized protein n=1 Tax=Trichonephila clavipes TaxID=2585209 RepID=A0A8X6RQG3_TRICX|nr:uncharacterized protein TNCV_2492791 [Trichonephila clavipes]
MFQRFPPKLLQCHLHRIGPQGIFCVIAQHVNDIDYTHRTQPSSVDAFHGLQLPPPLKIEPLLVVPSYTPACSVVNDNLCDHLLFGVKPHYRYETSNVAHASVSQTNRWCYHAHSYV